MPDYIDRFVPAYLIVCFATLFALAATHYLLVKHVSKKGRIDIPKFWFFSLSWIIHTCDWSWLRRATDSVLFKIELSLIALWFILMFSTLAFILAHAF